MCCCHGYGWNACVVVMGVVGMRVLLSWVWLECMCCCHGYSWNACVVVMGMVGMHVLLSWV